MLNAADKKLALTDRSKGDERLIIRWTQEVQWRCKGDNPTLGFQSLAESTS